LIETPKECQACHDSWPSVDQKRYTRAMCKRMNWIGKVDYHHYNEKLIDIPEFNEVASRFEDVE
jgi:hypothetical protein